MTGRELIVYILSNNLENEEVFKDGKILGYLTVDEAAVKLNVGPATIKSLIAVDMIKGVIAIGEEVLIPGISLENISVGCYK